MKKLGLVLILLVAALAAAAVALPRLVPVESHARDLLAALGRRLGHEVAVEGPIRLRVLPRPAIAISGVSVAGTGGGRLAAADTVEATLDPWPLLSGRVVVSDLVVEGPAVTLALDAEGRGNWRRPADAGGGPAPAPTPPPAPQGPTGGERTAAEPPAAALAFERVRVSGGRVEWSDARSGRRHVATDIEARAAWPDLAGPGTLEADLRLDGRPVSVEASVGPGAQGPRPLRLTAAGEPLRLSFDGQADVEARTAAGRVEAAAPSLAAAAAWLALGEGLPDRPARLAGRVEAAPERVSLAGGEVGLGAHQARADLALALGGPRPRLTGSVAAGRLVLDRPARASGAGDAAPASAPKAAPAAAPSPAVQSPAAPSPAVQSPAAPSPGSPPAAPRGPTGTPPAGTPAAGPDLSGLRALDAALDVALDGLETEGLELGPARGRAVLEAGRLELRVADAALHDGTVSGRLTLDGNRPVPPVALDLRFSGVQAGPLLRRLADFDGLTGAASGSVALTGQGTTPDALIPTLDGRGALSFKDGAFRGIDLAHALQAALATLRGGASGAGQGQTAFAELAASWTMADGVARTDDLRLAGPLLNATGAGTVDLPAETLDLRLEARAPETGVDFAVPLHLRGPIASPSVSPDLTGLAGRALGGRKPEEAVRGVIEGIGAGQKPIDALRGLFGR
jgi:AsmA protein